MTENLINRISFYLASGGLFNPELADHLAVRNLLMECREALAQRTWVDATTWRGLTDDEIVLIVADCASSHQHTDIHFARAIETKLRSKNESKN